MSLPHPRETQDRCALRAQVRGDPMLGTAFPAGRVLLVEQPGPWGQAGLRHSHFAPAVAARLEAELGRRGVRVLAIRRYGRTPVGEPRHWGFADCRPGRQSLIWGTFDADADLLGFDPDRGDLAHDEVGARPVEVDDAPVHLVCAHSTHDACCALRGRPVAAALAAVRPDRVWECSHVGGERFAANVLVLPLGLLYGRVLPGAGPEFVAAAERGEVVGALLRGHIGLIPAAQVALGFAHTELAIARAGAVTVRGVRSVPGGGSVVRLSTPSGLVDVVVEVERAPAARLTCQAVQDSAFLVHRPVSITPVA